MELAICKMFNTTQGCAYSNTRKHSLQNPHKNEGQVEGLGIPAMWELVEEAA